MSEFKFACPTCGQHIKCDSSQTGMIMDCPTCFQKLSVPQAPADGGQKLILTGTKVKKAAPDARPLQPVVPIPRSAGPWVVILILLFVGVVAAAIYWATLLHPRHAVHGPIPQSPPLETAPPPEPPAAPAPAPPPASDANWTLALEDSPLPESPAAGRIHGQDFLVERASFQNGSLILRSGSTKSLEFGVQINFGGLQAEALSGKNINIATNAEKAARINLRWKDGDTVQKADYDSGYALRLEFGLLSRNHLPGKIYLCLPDDEKSYVLGAFTAGVSGKARSKK